jgi:hypothetical protein
MANIKRALTSGITKTGTAVADVPDAPTIGTATASGLTASVTFTPAVTGGTPTSYTVTSSPGGFTGTSATSPITVSGLTDGTSYTFTVTATNSAGTSAASSASNSITAVAPLEGAYDALTSIVVPSGGVSSITFNGIPTTYKHLQIRGSVRSTKVDTSDMTWLTMNGDVNTANYISHSMSSTGSTNYAGVSTGDAYIRFTRMSAASNLSNVFSGFVLDVLDYNSSTKNKTIRSLSGYSTTSTDGWAYMGTGLWMSTSAMTTLSFGCSNNFAEFSTISLYGVK